MLNSYIKLRNHKGYFIIIFILYIHSLSLRSQPGNTAANIVYRCIKKYPTTIVLQMIHLYVLAVSLNLNQNFICFADYPD